MSSFHRCIAGVVPVLVLTATLAGCGPKAPQPIASVPVVPGAIASPAATEHPKELVLFWDRFQRALQAGDRAAVAGMMVFPMTGAWQLADFLDRAAGMSRKEFLEKFLEVFYPELILVILAQTAAEIYPWSPRQPHGNEAVYSLSLTVPKGTKANFDRGVELYLGLKDGQYRLLSIHVEDGDE